MIEEEVVDAVRYGGEQELSAQSRPASLIISQGNIFEGNDAR